MLRQTLQGPLCSYLSQRFKCCDQDAEELTADVLFKVHAAVSTFNPDGGAELTTWIWRIAQNRGIDWVRRQKRLIATVPLDEDTEHESNRARVNDWFRDHLPDRSSPSRAKPEKSDHQKDVECARRARAALSADDRRLLEERLTMSNREIADAEGVPEGTIRTRYSRAAARFKAAFEKEKNS
jgi:RNA polymerase sigma factor (sigma-70 family)